MLLFQRLVLITTQSDGKIEDFLKYELTTFPTALFDDSCMMREAKKENIAEHLWKKLGAKLFLCLRSFGA